MAKHPPDRPGRDPQPGPAMVAGPAGRKRRRVPGIRGDFAANRARILPQLVPPSMLDFCRADGRELVTLPFPGGLAVVFVVDEPDRYCFISTEVQGAWAVSEVDLLAEALTNLRRISQGLVWKRIGTGSRSYFLCETFDGYDASRILLSRELTKLAGRVAGNLVVGIPHRDYLVALGDGDPAFVAEVAETIREDFLRGTYPITPDLYTLEEGRITAYQQRANEKRLVN